MFIGKIECPDSNFHFRMYYNEKACNDAMVLPCHSVDSNGKLLPGMLGKLVFKSRDCVRTGVIAHEAVHLASTYMRAIDESYPVFSIEIDESEEYFAYLVGWFAARIGTLYYES